MGNLQLKTSTKVVRHLLVLCSKEIYLKCGIQKTIIWINILPSGLVTEYLTSSLKLRNKSTGPTGPVLFGSTTDSKH